MVSWTLTALLHVPLFCRSTKLQGLVFGHQQWWWKLFISRLHHRDRSSKSVKFSHDEAVVSRVPNQCFVPLLLSCSQRCHYRAGSRLHTVGLFWKRWHVRWEFGKMGLKLSNIRCQDLSVSYGATFFWMRWLKSLSFTGRCYNNMPCLSGMQ